jgi:hypothetical protein
MSKTTVAVTPAAASPQWGPNMPTSIEAIMFTGVPLPEVSIETCGQAAEVINAAATRTKKPLTAKQAAGLLNSVHYGLAELALADRAALRAISK